MPVGASYDAHVLVGEQTAVGTAATPTITLPRKTETIKSKRIWTPAGAPHGSREVTEMQKGIQSAEGGINFDLYPGVLGWFMKWLFGGVSTTAALPGSITATPTGTPGAGGTIPDGTYYYQVASVYTRDSDGEKLITNPKPTAAVTVGTGNNTVVVDFVLPAVPTGYTRVNNYIYRTAASGSVGTAKYLAKVGAATLTYSDTGSATLSSIPIPGTVYEHVFAPAALVSGTDVLKYFTMLKMMDLGSSAAQQYNDGKVGKMTISSPNNQSAPAGLAFDVKFCRALGAAEGSPTYTQEQACMAWQTQLLIDGTQIDRLKQWQVEADNGLEFLMGSRGNKDYPRGISAAQRMKTGGSVTLQMENQTEWLKMIAGTPFAAIIFCDGGETTPTAAVTAESAKSWPGMCRIHLPACYYEEAGGNQNEDKLMDEPLKFVCRKDASAGYGIQVKLFNTTASYPDAA